jgi:hypothetical protein
MVLEIIRRGKLVW